MKNIWTIMKKELARVFKDVRLVLTILVLPGLMIFAMYNIMGDAMSKINSEGTEKTAEIYIANLPDSFAPYFEIKDEDNNKVVNANIKALTMEELEAKKDILYKGKGVVDLIITFEEDFDEKLAMTDDFVAPTIDIYYNPSSNLSDFVNTQVVTLLTAYQKQIQDVKFGDTTVFDQNMHLVHDIKKTEGKAFAMIFPFLIITFLFSGAMSVGPESIAGEKERGTISTLLITPTKRSHIALGKVFSLSILAILSAVSSFIGVILSFPKLFGDANVDASIYGFGEYAGTLLILIVTCFLIIGLISIVSAYAKNIKEASMYVTPLFLVSMIIGITTMFTSEPPSNNLLYLIPIYNSVQVLAGLFSFNFNITHMLITVGTNVALTGLLIFVLTRMFNSEKMMFSK